MAEHRNLILMSVLIGTLMSAVDTTIVILAILSITIGLNTTPLSSIWVILSYLLVLAALTTQMGRLGDIFGRRRIFNMGFLVFILGSALCGASPSANFLIASRVVQGFGAVLLQANGTAIVADNFEPHERGRAYGIISMGWNVGGILGIVLGGVITTLIGWRYIFYINVPIGMIGFLAGVRYIKDNKRTAKNIDYAGTSILLALLVLIAYGTTDIAGHGLTTFNLLMIVLGIFCIIPFVLVERYVKDPVILLRAFKERMLTYSLLAAMLQSIGYLSVVFVLILYLQGIRGFDPLTSSLILVPGYILSGFLSPFMGRLADRFGAGKMATIGIFFLAMGVLVYFFLQVGSDIFLVIAGTLVAGLGGAMFWPSNSTSVMASSPRELYGSISGLLRTLTSMGILFSYVITISVASLSVPRSVAFSVFLGLPDALGGVPSGFMWGLRSALLASMIILIIAGVLSSARARSRQEKSVEMMAPRSGGSTPGNKT